MTDMLKLGMSSRTLGTFQLTPAIKQSVKELYQAFIEDSVLAHFDAARQVCHKTDASGFAMADIMLHQQNNIYKVADGTTQVWGPSINGQ